jgi:hypothetical protein
MSTKVAEVMATEANDYASVSPRLDRVGDRFDRLGRWLDPTEATR